MVRVTMRRELCECNGEGGLLQSRIANALPDQIGGNQANNQADQQIAAADKYRLFQVFHLLVG